MSRLRMSKTMRTSRISTALLSLVLGTAVLGTIPATAGARPTATDTVQSRDLAPQQVEKAQRAGRGTGLMLLEWGDLDRTKTAGHSYVVMQPWEGHRIAAMKRANPRLTVLMYKNVAAVRKDTHESGLSSTGLTYAEVENTNPSWFLRDSSGTILEWSDWSGLYPVDISSPAYQDRWVANVTSELRGAAWDGVMLDDTLTTLSHPTHGNRVSAKISDDAAMYRATESFLAEVGPRLKRSGYLAIPNLTVFWDNWKTTVPDWTRYVSGWESEYFVKWGLDSSAGRMSASDDWTWKMDMAKWLAARNVPLLAITYSNRTDRVSQVYHRASWLLTWNGRTGAGIFTPAEDVSHNLRLANLHLGKPSSKAVVRSGLHARRYTRGLVLVNPSSRARTVRLPQRYKNPAGKVVRVVRLAPRTGALLRKIRR